MNVICKGIYYRFFTKAFPNYEVPCFLNCLTTPSKLQGFFLAKEGTRKLFIDAYGINIRKATMKSSLFQDLTGEIERLTEGADA